MKFIKWASITIICLVILIIISLLLLPKFINANQYKFQIESAIKKRTGRDLRLTGDISWSLLPSVSLQVQDGTVSNPNNFSKMGHFAVFKKVVASVELLPLLHGEVKVDSLKYSGATINLERLGNGQDNWHFIKQRINHLAMNENDSLAVGVDTVKDEASLKKRLSLSIQNITLEDVKINYKDNKQSGFILLNNFNMQLNQDSHTHSIEYKLDVNFSTKYVKNASSAGSGRISFSDHSIILENIRQQFNFISRSHGSYNTNISGNVMYDAETNLITSNISFYVQNLLNIYVQNISYNSKSNDYSLEATIDSAQESAILDRLGINLPTSDLVDLNVAWDIKNLTFRIKGSHNKVEIQNIAGSIGRSNISGNVSIISLEPYQSNFNLDIYRLNLNDYIDMGGAEIFFNHMNINGNLSDDSAAIGEVTLNAKSAILSGLDINVLAVKFQNFLKSIVNMNHVGKNFQEIRHELMTLNIIGVKPQIDKNNGQETKIYNFLMVNSIKDNTIYTRKFNWDGNEFTLRGVGQIDLSSRVVNYALKAYVFNPNDTKLEAYQKIYIPFNMAGEIGDIKFTTNQKDIEKQLQPVINKTLQNVINDKAHNLLKQLLH